ncbi:hypothetical protein [Acidaminobacterium chupaoyuni]
MTNASNPQWPLSYKGRPLMRKDSTIYYGSMTDKYIIMLKVVSFTKNKDLEVAGKVRVELQLTDPDISSVDKVVKSTEKEGLYNAMDIASIWLDRALNQK